MEGSCLQGGADKTDDPILTREVCHAMHIILGLKLGDHQGLTLFIQGQLLKRTLLLVLPEILIRIHAFLSPIPAYRGVQPGTSWCCPAAAGPTPAPGTQLQETQHPYFALLSVLLVLLVKLFYYLICTSLCLFLLLPWWESGLAESICCSAHDTHTEQVCLHYLTGTDNVTSTARP